MIDLFGNEPEKMEATRILVLEASMEGQPTGCSIIQLLNGVVYTDGLVLKSICGVIVSPVHPMYKRKFFSIK